MVIATSNNQVHWLVVTPYLSIEAINELLLSAKSRSEDLFLVCKLSVGNTTLLDVNNLLGYYPLSVADLGGREGRAPPPPWVPKFFRFHAVFGKIWQNVGAPLESWRPLEKSWIRR